MKNILWNSESLLEIISSDIEQFEQLQKEMKFWTASRLAFYKEICATPTTISELAHNLGITTRHVRRMADSLERKGFIKKNLRRPANRHFLTIYSLPGSTDEEIELVLAKVTVNIKEKEREANYQHWKKQFKFEFPKRHTLRECCKCGRILSSVFRKGEEVPTITEEREGKKLMWGVCPDCQIVLAHVFDIQMVRML